MNVIADFVDPPAGLGDRYRVDARIVVWESPDVLKVPTSALFRRGGDWNLFVIDVGRAVSRRVQIGQHNASEAEVVDGIGEAALVIVHPDDQVADGVRVRVS